MNSARAPEGNGPPTAPPLVPVILSGGEPFLVHENQSTFIPRDTRHRLENPGEAPLELIEVQAGDYLGEDDIVPFDDACGRTDV